MILLALLVLSGVVSSQQQTTPECEASAAAYFAQSSCVWAVGNLSARAASPDQLDLVCNDTLGCKNVYRSYLRDCIPVSYVCDGRYIR